MDERWSSVFYACSEFLLMANISIKANVWSPKPLAESETYIAELLSLNFILCEGR